MEPAERSQGTPRVSPPPPPPGAPAPPAGGSQHVDPHQSIPPHPPNGKGTPPPQPVLLSGRRSTPRPEEPEGMQPGTSTPPPAGGSRTMTPPPQPRVSTPTPVVEITSDRQPTPTPTPPPASTDEQIIPPLTPSEYFSNALEQLQKKVGDAKGSLQLMETDSGTGTKPGQAPILMPDDRLLENDRRWVDVDDLDDETLIRRIESIQAQNISILMELGNVATQPTTMYHNSHGDNDELSLTEDDEETLKEFLLAGDGRSLGDWLADGAEDDERSAGGAATEESAPGAQSLPQTDDVGTQCPKMFPLVPLRTATAPFVSPTALLRELQYNVRLENSFLECPSVAALYMLQPTVWSDKGITIGPSSGGASSKTPEQGQGQGQGGAKPYEKIGTELPGPPAEWPYHKGKQLVQEIYPLFGSLLLRANVKFISTDLSRGMSADFIGMEIFVLTNGLVLGLPKASSPSSPRSMACQTTTYFVGCSFVPGPRSLRCPYMTNFALGPSSLRGKRNTGGTSPGSAPYFAPIGYSSTFGTDEEFLHLYRAFHFHSVLEDGKGNVEGTRVLDFVSEDDVTHQRLMTCLHHLFEGNQKRLFRPLPYQYIGAEYLPPLRHEGGKRTSGGASRAQGGAAATKAVQFAKPVHNMVFTTEKYPILRVLSADDMAFCRENHCHPHLFYNLKIKYLQNPTVNLLAFPQLVAALQNPCAGDPRALPIVLALRLYDYLIERRWALEVCVMEVLPLS